MVRLPQDRLRGIHHVVHDYVNLVSAGELVLTDLPPRINSHVQHCFLMNSRTLANFFMNRGEWDDIKSKHYLTSKVKFSLPIWESWRKHMDKHLMHLTYARIDNKRPWVGGPVNRQILQEMQSAWEILLSKVEAPFKSEFEKEIRAKEQSEFSSCRLR